MIEKLKTLKRAHIFEGILHLLFWLLFFASINISWSSNWFDVENRIGPVAPLAAIIFFIFFYFNAFYLIPKYLKKRKWIKYGVSLLIVFVFFEFLRIVLHSTFAKAGFDSFQDIIKELQSSDSLILGRLTPLIVSLQFSLTYRFTRDWIVNNVVIDRLKTEKLQMELSVLKAQINPHFLFNSLNALDDLIDRDVAQAKKYLNKLSKIYRYTLTSMDEDVVPLKDELDFINDFIFLLEERFGGMYLFEKSIETADIHKYLIPPASLQLLLENAVKHNYGSLENPLKITISVKEDNVKVHHLKSLKRVDVESTGKGLLNIKKRFQFLSSTSVIINDTDTNFSVTLPLIKNIRAK